MTADPEVGVGTQAPARATFPVIEAFGPTIQGEGRLAGLPTHFVRFGGCDYRCSWCDSLYAVTPTLVRANATKLTAGQVMEHLADLGGDPEWVTLSGGNPALLELGDLVERLHDDGRKVAVETQGSRWRDWLDTVDCLTVSPKPPSSGMVSVEHTEQTGRFLRRAQTTGLHTNGALKIVAFDDADLDWASGIFDTYPDWPAFLSVGTDPPAVDEPWLLTVEQICDRYRWLCAAVAGTPAFARVRVFPQLHLLAYGHARGV